MKISKSTPLQFDAAPLATMANLDLVMDLTDDLARAGWGLDNAIASYRVSLTLARIEANAVVIDSIHDAIETHRAVASYRNR